MDEAGAKKALLVEPADEESLQTHIHALEAKKAEAAKALTNTSRSSKKEWTSRSVAVFKYLLTSNKKAEAAKAEDYDKAAELKKEIDKLQKELKHVDKVETPVVTAKDIYRIIEQKTNIPMSELHP